MLIFVLCLINLICPKHYTGRNQLYIFSCATGPAQSGILFDREVVNLFLHFTVNPKPRVEYNDRPRCSLRGKECSISRFQQVESRWGYSGTSDRIRWDLRPRNPPSQADRRPFETERFQIESQQNFYTISVMWTWYYWKFDLVYCNEHVKCDKTKFKIAIHSWIWIKRLTMYFNFSLQI